MRVLQLEAVCRYSEKRASTTSIKELCFSPVFYFVSITITLKSVRSKENGKFLDDGIADRCTFIPHFRENEILFENRNILKCTFFKVVLTIE